VPREGRILVESFFVEKAKVVGARCWIEYFGK
jgi:hypothetical protein